MNILVISGSPKGKYSITLQSMLYLQKYFSDDVFTILDAGAKIKTYEKDINSVKPLLDNADLIIFAYPVYTCLATSQLHRFFELLFENNISLNNTSCTQFTTSKHFYDMTAHRAVEQIISDLGGNYIKGLSADMDDLTRQNGQKVLVLFFEYLKYAHENRLFEQLPAFQPINKANYLGVVTPFNGKKLNKTVAIITNCGENDTILKAMISDFSSVAPFNAKIYNVSDMNLRGGCLGCLNCTADGTCVYNDGFQQLLRNDIEKCDSMVFAFSPNHHTMGSDFKMFDDRRFCNGHRTNSVGQPTAYLVGSNLENEPNLYELMEARAEIAGNYLCGIVTPSQGAEGIQKVVDKIEFCLTTGYFQPQNFYGEGGRRIFRDLVFTMQGVMRADHKFYKNNGLYDDLPQKLWKQRYLMKLAGTAFNNKKLRSKLKNQINDGMLMPYKKVIDSIDNNTSDHNSDKH